ncbi:MAG: YiiX/YebB-like N1pC/P60 family cysteine hydrolase [Thioalkalispiraceae bacterium]
MFRLNIIIICICIVLSGCLVRPVVIKTDAHLHEEQNTIIQKAIKQVAKTGDWLVIRGYHATDNLVANATGIPISHVGVYNAENKSVIEAEGKGVHLSSFSEFIDKSYRIIVIRPRWKNKTNSMEVWNEAKRLVGRSYDFLGTIGFNYPAKYYCSELAINIYKPWFSGNEKFPDVIKPGELYLYGVILYDSLPRDEM